MLDKEHNVMFETSHITEFNEGIKSGKIDNRLTQRPKNFDLEEYDNLVIDKHSNGMKPPPAKWHGCKTTPTGPQTGEILVCFDIIDA